MQETLAKRVPATVEFGGTYDACIDGTTGNMTADFKWVGRGTATVTSRTEEETWALLFAGTTFKKYTLLSNK